MKTAMLIGMLLLLSGCTGGGSLVALTPGASGTAAPTATAPPAAPTLGVPTFTNGGSGDCTNGLIFTGPGQSATLPIVQPGYTGAYTATSSAPAVASASIAGATVTITTLGAGTTFVRVSDSNNGTIGCNVGVTVSSGSVS